MDAGTKGLLWVVVLGGLGLGAWALYNQNDKNQSIQPVLPEQQTIQDNRTVSGPTQSQPEPQQELKEEKGPRVYGMGEWVRVGDDRYNLEWKIDRVFRKRIAWSDISKEMGVKFDGISPQGMADMQSRYFDFLILKFITRATSDNEEKFDLDWFSICYPSGCPMYKEKGTSNAVLRMLNGNESLTKAVTLNTLNESLVPYLIYTNVEGDPLNYPKVPEGILRVGTELDGYVRQVEIGNIDNLRNKD